MNNNIPKKVELHESRSSLIITYQNMPATELTAEYLRVFSPSAEVRGHGTGNEVLQTGKRHALITNIEQVGNYALKFSFSDGHDSGIYTWDYLRSLCDNADEYWDGYLQRLEMAEASRD